jgi:hypothetical protein
LACHERDPPGWSLDVSHLKHQIQAAASWRPETALLRRDLEIMVQVGNEVFGEDGAFDRNRTCI